MRKCGVRAARPLVALALLAFACGPFRVKADRLEKARKVALAALSLHVQLHEAGQAGSSDAIASGIVMSTQLGDLPARAEAALRKVLVQDLRADVVPLADVEANQRFQRLRSGLGVIDGDTGVTHPALLSSARARRLDDGELERIREALGVDAIVVARVMVFVGDTSGYSLLGMGNREKHLAARVDVLLLDRGRKNPAWRDPDAIGDATSRGIPEASLVKVMQGVEIPVALIQELVPEAVESACRALGARLRKKLGR